jgi:hypothetical protein
MTIEEGFELMIALVPTYVVDTVREISTFGWPALFGIVSIGSAATSVVLANRHRSRKLFWGLAPVLGSFATVFYGGLYTSQRMEMDDPSPYFTGFELALIASLFLTLRPYWGLAVAWSIFCATLFVSADLMADDALRYDMA